jgi:hypothetical protein
MWRSGLIGVALAGVLTGCSSFGGDEGGSSVPAGGSELSAVITRHSLGGIELGQTEAAVERLTGAGRKLRKPGENEVAYHVPGGGLIVTYGSLVANKPQDAVLVASTDSPWFRTFRAWESDRPCHRSKPSVRWTAGRPIPTTTNARRWHTGRGWSSTSQMAASSTLHSYNEPTSRPVAP